MSPAERRLDFYKLLSLVVAVPLVVVGVTSATDALVLLAVYLMGVVNLGTEVVRARRYGHPFLNRWIPRRRREDRARAPARRPLP